MLSSLRKLALWSSLFMNSLIRFLAIGNLKSNFIHLSWEISCILFTFFWHMVHTIFWRTWRKYYVGYPSCYHILCVTPSWWKHLRLLLLSNRMKVLWCEGELGSRWLTGIVKRVVTCIWLLGGWDGYLDYPTWGKITTGEIRRLCCGTGHNQSLDTSLAHTELGLVMWRRVGVTVTYRDC